MGNGASLRKQFVIRLASQPVWLRGSLSLLAAHLTYNSQQRCTSRFFPNSHPLFLKGLPVGDKLRFPQLVVSTSWELTGREELMSHSKRYTSLKSIVHQLPIPTFGQYTPIVGLVGLIGATLAGSLLAGILLRAVLTKSGPNDMMGINPASMTTPNPDFVVPALLGQETDRTTIVLLGSDTRPAETGYRMPTDTIILLTIDRKQHAGMLSIPRDLYVDIPGYGLDRINTAYVKGGGSLVMETIKQNLGVQVDHYVLVQFDAFTTLVDEVGGIDVHVPYTIDDPTFPAECYSRDDCGFEPLYIEAGQHHFDGLTALRYARTRHGDNDYERARRQQSVIMAVRQRVLSLNMLPTLIGKAPRLYETLSQNISTDMSLDEIIQLVQAASDLPDDSVHSAVIDAEAVTPTQVPNGASVLMPNHDRIKELLALIFWL
jgi:LCP family protein required for cell wall assembly